MVDVLIAWSSEEVLVVQLKTATATNVDIISNPKTNFIFFIFSRS